MDNEFWCKCGDCKHEWMLFKTPINMDKAIKAMRNVICPKCHSGKILIGKTKKESKTNIYNTNASLVTTALKVPLIEDLPKGFMAVREGKRNLTWRDDKASTLVWTEALDEGDPEKKVTHRDEVLVISLKVRFP